MSEAGLWGMLTMGAGSLVNLLAERQQTWWGNKNVFGGG